MSVSATLNSHTSEEREKQMEQKRDRERRTALKRFLEEENTEFERIPEEHARKSFLERNTDLIRSLDWLEKRCTELERIPELPFEHLAVLSPWKSEHKKLIDQETGLIIQLKKQMKQKKDRLEEEELLHMRACIARLEEELLHAHIERSEPQEKRMKQEKDREVAPKSEQQEEQMTGRFLLWDDVKSPFFRWLCLLYSDKEQLERKNQQLKAQLEACETEKEQLEEKYRKLEALLEASVSETEKTVASPGDSSDPEESEEDSDFDYAMEDNYYPLERLGEEMQQKVNLSREYIDAMNSVTLKT